MGLSEDELYEPSQELGADLINVRSSDRRRTTVAAQGRIAQMYAKGGMLDSQTTDSQFEFAKPTANIADEPKESKEDLSHNDLESYRRGGTASPEAPPLNEPTVSADHDELRATTTSNSLSASIDFQHNRQLQQDLVFARVEIQMLRDQVGHLETIRDLQEERISELRMQLFDATHMLDPEEQSQVLIEVPRRAPSAGTSAHGCATGIAVTVGKHSSTAHGSLGAGMGQLRTTYKRKRA